MAARSPRAEGRATGGNPREKGESAVNERHLVEDRHLTHVYGQENVNRPAVNDISFHIREGETFGLVGESGCGKTTTGRMLVRLLEMTSGSVEFDGQSIAALRGRAELLRFRKNAQIIFQDPYASLDPRKKVYDIIAEGIDVHQHGKELPGQGGAGRAAAVERRSAPGAPAALSPRVFRRSAPAHRHRALWRRARASSSATSPSQRWTR